MTKISIGLPTNRQVKIQTVVSLLDMVKSSPYELNIIPATQGFTISENRAYLAIQAIRAGSSHILMVDDDMIFPHDTLDQLIKDDKDIVGVLAHSRSLNFNYMVTLLGQTDRPFDADVLMGKVEIPKTLFECEAIGSSVLLIKTDVFNNIEKPWFDMEKYDNGMTKMGEDYWFCKQAKKAGYKIFCDPTLTIGHVGDYVY